MTLSDLAIIATVIYLRSVSDTRMHNTPLPTDTQMLVRSGHLEAVRTVEVFGSRVILRVTHKGRDTLSKVPFIDIMRELAEARVEEVIDYWMGDIELKQLPEFLAHNRVEVQRAAKKRLVMLQEPNLYAFATK